MVWVPTVAPAAAMPSKPATPGIFHILMNRCSTATMTDGLTMREAAHTAHTGDVFLFRGPTVADRTIRAVTKNPVNHVGMVIALDDLPPLPWHAELGQSLPDVWAGESNRGRQLHRLTDAIGTRHHKYGQAAWMRRIDVDATREMEDQVLRVVNELDRTTFPRTGTLVAAGPGTQEERPRAIVLRRGGGNHLRADGATRIKATIELVRPRQILERRST
ncbi:MAG: hypothetical protein ACJAXA_001365 [Candidatus Aldehydirespiratoraceae bacterium]|jgi:hypothetical protein